MQDVILVVIFIVTLLLLIYQLLFYYNKSREVMCEYESGKISFVKKNSKVVSLLYIVISSPVIIMFPIVLVDKLLNSSFDEFCFTGVFIYVLFCFFLVNLFSVAWIRDDTLNYTTVFKSIKINLNDIYKCTYVESFVPMVTVSYYKKNIISWLFLPGVKNYEQLNVQLKKYIVIK